MRRRHKHKADKATGAVLGWIALPVLLAAVVYALFLAIAQWLYFDAKYGFRRDNDRAALAALDTCFTLDGHHYAACEDAARHAWDLAQGQTGAPRVQADRLTRLWCERSLALNPYQRSMRWMMSQILAREDPARAVQEWEAYVKGDGAWQGDFWNPENHLILADLALQAKQIEAAVEALHWAEGARGWDAMAARVKAARTAAK